MVELVGAGRAFSSGVDLDALAAAADPAEYRDSFALLLRELSAFPKPLLAGVHGAAVGFGMTILLHADVVVVADDARRCAPGNLRRELRALARQIAVHPPDAIAAAKRLLRSGRAEQAEAALRREDMESRALRAGRSPLGRSSLG